MTEIPVARTIREQVADRIRADVLSGKITEGTSLREHALAKQYSVSRAPIRDALLQLTQEGLLVAKPNCGVRVAAVKEETQGLLVELRRQIEVTALRNAFEKFDEHHVERLQRTVDRLEAACVANDLGAVVENDMALHRLIIDATGNPDLLAIWLPIVSRMMLHYERHNNMLESHQEHARIVDAIRSGDEEAAVDALLVNIQ
ncbi:GntR family transcriptional regulator [Botrimarina hoheduenensis]|uniref:Putative HTH-type transcriptional regulator YdfH n=1 Tax=Botrimarina hoheduenensis TaxID=2528000 RepID=A0A5C5VT06_9BACT|nr:GntR family transcriptional regulator [Botrimarina hoheduenensis]TWT40672.1 putative HTH-type transcriptional regulator YdfH [Botrimarina hoheduenensis]